MTYTGKEPLSTQQNDLPKKNIQADVLDNRFVQDEAKRLQLLDSYDIMYSKHEDAFDRITKLVNAFIDVPVVGISFIDKDNQFLKSSTGINMPVIPRSQSLCNFTIRGTEPWIVSNTLESDVLKNHPMVINEPYVRFYAGFPILVKNELGEQFALGALCLVDNKVRPALTDCQIQTLQNFSQIISDTLQLRLEKLRTERASLIKTAFLTNLSHEINTPMAGIMGMLDALAQTPLNEQQNSFVKHIKSSNEHLVTIVNDMLELSQVEAGRLSYEPKLANLRELCEKIITTFTKMADEQKILLTLDYPSTIATMIRLDAQRFEQIVSKLITNAIKFTPAGGKVTLQIASECQHSNVKISVIDTGIGISDDTKAVIFEAYEHADKFTHRMYGGIGLGLSLCKALAAGMGGDLTVNSQTGQGSTFCLTLPLNLTDSEKAQAQHNQQEASQNAVQVLTALPRLSAHILLVEDNELNAMVALKTLKKYGYTADRARDGQEAVNLFSNEPNKYNMILMDHQMPIMDGVQATKVLKERFAATLPPVIAVTAHATHGDQSIYYDVGMQDCIAKPYKPEMLDNIIQKWLNYQPVIKLVRDECPTS